MQLEGLKLLSPRLSELKDLPFTAADLRYESTQRATKMSIQGVQYKMCAQLNIANHQFDIVDTEGHFILKKLNPYFFNFIWYKFY